MNSPPNNGSVEVAEAHPDDADAYACFVLAAWREAGPDAPGFAGATDEAIAEIASRDIFLARIGERDHRMFLARAAGDAVGFAATRLATGTEVELSGIVVLAAARGRGVGAALVDAARRASIDDGFVTMVVRTEIDNDPAIRFYETHGFATRGPVVERIDGISIDLVELSCELTVMG